MSETVSVNGRNVSYRQIQGSGAGRTILMVHGAGDHSWIWNSQTDFRHVSQHCWRDNSGLEVTTSMVFVLVRGLTYDRL